ncbi:hypothetical protein KQX54_014283 [Cotesia glomerata]|uniref:CCHC-type domain-containing protein n=1 Tax=Cotesia glomerata TaxID=32391 RepID=A0AAV7J521_COTGL|nr:hypothetical protein KQX54_014283 [Cotesia glomerata]
MVVIDLKQIKENRKLIDRATSSIIQAGIIMDKTANNLDNVSKKLNEMIGLITESKSKELELAKVALRMLELEAEQKQQKTEVKAQRVTTSQDRNGKNNCYRCAKYGHTIDQCDLDALTDRWCYQRGKTSSKSMKYPLSSENPPLRDHEMYLTDLEQLKKDLETLPKTKKNEKYTVFGVKGSSVLSNLPDFDCIWGFPHLYAWGIIRS